MPKPMNLLTKEQIEEFYVHGGMSLKAASEALGVSEPTLIRYMKKFGMKGRTTKRPPAFMEAYAGRDALIQKHYETGWSMNRIADKFQISKQRVSIILKKGK